MSQTVSNSKLCSFNLLYSYFKYILAQIIRYANINDFNVFFCNKSLNLKHKLRNKRFDLLFVKTSGKSNYSLCCKTIK